MEKSNAILEQAAKGSQAVNSVSAPAMSPADTLKESMASNLQLLTDTLATSKLRLQEGLADRLAGQEIVSVAGTSKEIAIQQAANAAKNIKLITDTAKLGAENTTIAAFNAAGGNQNMIDLMSIMNKDDAEIDRLLEIKADVTDDTHTGFQPIDKFINDLRSVQTDALIAVATRQRDQTVKELTNITLATESVARATALTTRTVNEGTIASNLDLIQANADKAIADQRIANVASNAEAFNATANAEQAQIQNMFTVLRSQETAQGMAARQARLDFDIRDMERQDARWETLEETRKVALDINKEALAIAKETNPSKKAALIVSYNRTVQDEKERVALEGQLINEYQLGQATSGNIITQDRETILYNLRLTGDAGRKAHKLRELGRSPNHALGVDPWEAFQTRSLVAANVPENKYTKMLAEINAKQEAKYSDPKGAGKPKDEATLKVDFNKTAMEHIASFTGDIRAGDGSNPYQAPPMNILATKKAVQKSIFYQKVIKGSGMVETDPEKIMMAGLAAVQAKRITIEEHIAGVETIFDAAAASNNKLEGGFERVGMPNQLNYMTQLVIPGVTLAGLLRRGAIYQRGLMPGGSAFGGTIDPEEVKEKAAERVSIDLMDYTSIRDASVRMLSGLGTKSNLKQSEQTQ